MKILITLFLLISFLYYGCGSCNCGNNEADLSKSTPEAEITKVESWFNMMPGGDPPSFHITGEVIVKPHSFQNLQLREIVIIQGSVLLYTFKPFLRELTSNDTNTEIKEGEKAYQFSTDRGLPINDEHKDADPIRVELVFVSEGRDFKIIKNDVEVIKAY
jgi:hypothetical protein